jgi:hypothetical protein
MGIISEKKKRNRRERFDGFSLVIFSEKMMIKKPKKGRPALGKITIQLRVQPGTRAALWRLAAEDHVTVIDHVEAVLLW